MRAHLCDVAELMQLPLDYLGAPAIVSLAGVVGRRACIQPKERDTVWREVPNLWGALVAPPGSLKTPAISMVTAPLNFIEAQWHLENQAAVAQWLEAKKAGPEPCMKRLVLNDSTFEKMHEIMSANPRGVIVFRDELSGWLADMERPGRESERSFYIQAWTGRTPYTLDRIGRGTIRAPALCLSLFVGIQPKRLQSFMAGEGGIALADDGLLQRLQVLVWPDGSRSYVYTDRQPNLKATDQMRKIFSFLGSFDENQREAVAFKFDPEAQEYFVDWYTALQNRLRGDTLSALLKSHFAKYAGLMPSLALLFQLAKKADASKPSITNRGGVLPAGLVTLAETERAANLCLYLESHANRVYGCSSPEQLCAQNLAIRLTDGAWRDSPFTIRDVRQKDWGGLMAPNTLTLACGILVQKHWIRVVNGEPNPMGGRPTTRYEVNPKVRGSLVNTEA